MQNLILSASVVLPLFFLMAAGFIAKRLNLFSQDAHDQMNNLVYRVFIPVLLFHNIYRTDLSGGVDYRVFLFLVIGLMLVFGIGFLVVPHLEKDNRCRSVLIQALGRSNFVLFGIPITEALFGDRMLLVTPFLVAVAVPILNILSVIALEVYRGEKVRVRQVIKSVALNPLIIGTVLGIIVMLTRISFPQFLEDGISSLAQIGTPFALFLLGGTIEPEKFRGNAKRLIIGVLGRLVVMPLIFLTAAVLLGFRDVELAALLVVFAAPAAVNSYTMAHQMGADHELAGQLVVLTTVFSILTMFLWIFVGKEMGVI